VNYYQRHIGDYSTDTRWLSTYQHGVYTLLLDWYYKNERAIPLDIAYRIVQARSGPERRGTDEVLTSFFDLGKSPGFAHNKRADIDIAKYKVKSEANSLIAKNGWDAKRIRSASETQCEPNASHKPVTNSQEEDQEKVAKATLSANADPKPKPRAIPPCPHVEIVALYHEILPANPGIKVWDGAREEALRTRWKEDEKRQNLDYWRRYLTYVSKSPFLTGREHGANERPFLPGLDWLVKAANFAKVIEGRYHDKGQS